VIFFLLLLAFCAGPPPTHAEGLNIPALVERIAT
jgi:hypothetical protein